MKKNINIIGIVLLLAVTLSASKCKKTSPTQIEQLPPATQTGANKFGCLLNGTAFIPGGGGLFSQVLTVQYDPTFQGGRLSISAKKILSSTDFITLSIGGNSIHTEGTYQLGLASKYGVYYYDTKKLCYFNNTDIPSPIINSGSLTITKFDQTTRILSGNFNFDISTSDCGNTKVSDGRFDVKF